MAKGTVIFFYPKVNKDNLNKNIPLPFLKLGSQITSSGYKIEIIDSRFDLDYKAKLQGLAADADCFCVSAMTGYQIKEGLEASKFVKGLRPDITVIWGGWHPSLLPAQTIENEFIDIVVRGQGEITLTELLKARFDNASLANVSGISFKSGTQIIHNQDRPFEDVNKFAPVNFDILDINKYTYGSYIGDKTIFWNSSQGCPFRCAFCCANKVYNRKWSALSAERVLGELKVLITRFGINGVCFVEDNFFVDKRRVENLCNGLIQSKLSLKWEVDGRADQIVRFDDEFLCLLKRSGCEKIYVGAESGDESVLKLIDKDIKIDDIYKSAELLNRHGIIAEMFLMVGFPENPKQDIDKTLSMIRNIKKSYPDHQATPFLYTPYPGNSLFELSIQRGLKVPQRLEDWSSWSVLDVMTPWVNRRYLDNINRMVKFYYPFTFPSASLKKLFKNKKWGIFYRLMHLIAKFRVMNNFFFMPIEWYMAKNFYYNLKLKYNMFNDITVPR